MELFRFDRAKAATSIEDPDGALWPVNAYSDADELNGLVHAALEARSILCRHSCAYIDIYPFSVSEPKPVLTVDPGLGPALLGYSLKLREGEGESPVEFTLRLLEEITVEANGLLAAAAGSRTIRDSNRDDMTLLCPRCCSEEAALVDRGTRLECGNCGAAFSREEALVTVAEAEAHAEERGAASAEGRPRGAPCGPRALSDAEALDTLAEELNGPGDWNGGDVCELAADLLRRTGRRIADEPDNEGVWR